MPKYVGKPSEVKAVEFQIENRSVIEDVFADDIKAGRLSIDWAKMEYVVHTGWGDLGGTAGDRIIEYKPGDIASCKAEAFEVYKQVEGKPLAYLKPGKPVEAVQWDGTEASYEAIKELNPDAVEAVRDDDGRIAGVSLLTIDANGKTEGVERIGLGDYVKKGGKGEVYANDEKTFCEKNQNEDGSEIKPLSERKGADGGDPAEK